MAARMPMMLAKRDLAVNKIHCLKKISKKSLSSEQFKSDSGGRGLAFHRAGTEIVQKKAFYEGFE